jgi:hypothetical protein
MELKTGAKYKGTHTFILTDSLGNVIAKQIKENIIVAVGRNKVNEILASGLDTDGINYCALGTGSTAIADSDIALESEGARILRGSYVLDEGTDSFIVSFYFNQSEGVGTWTRYATFIDGTSTADTGTMFSHLEISLTKSSGEGLTINSEYVLYDAS